MAQFSTDFSTGSISDWLLAGDGFNSGEVTIGAVSGSLSGNGLMINNDGTSTDRYFVLTWTSAGSADDWEVLMHFRAPQGFDQYKGGAGAIARIDTGNALRPGYGARTSRNGYTSNRTNALVSGNLGNTSGTDFASANILANPPPTNTWIWQRLRCNGTNVRAWFWLDGDAAKTNATAPDLEGTDATYTTGAAGIAWDCADNEFASGVELEVDYFAVGTAGDAAPAYGGAPPPSTQRNRAIMSLLGVV